MLVDALMTDPGPNIYYDTDFRNVLEDHMTYLRHHPQTRVVTLEPGKIYKNEFDFFGLLSEYSIEPWMQWVVMRMNYLSSPLDELKNLNELLIPDPTIIERIRQSYATTSRIT